jgi:hypothetical protein
LSAVSESGFNVLSVKRLMALTEKLNSERIEFIFGNYHIDVLPNTIPSIRVSNLYSMSDEIQVTQTLAIVLFHLPISEELFFQHKLIEEGGSIGVVLKKSDWTIQKESLYLGETVIEGSLMSMMQLPHTSKKTALHIYDLSVLKCGKEAVKNMKYCTIIEIYNPKYLTLTGLENLYPRALIQNKKTKEWITENLNRVHQVISTL